MPVVLNFTVWVQSMTAAKRVRNGRFVFLRLRNPMACKEAVRLGPYVIGYWSRDEREWFLVTDEADWNSTCGWSLIDDDFVCWAHLPACDGAELRGSASTTAADDASGTNP